MWTEKNKPPPDHLKYLKKFAKSLSKLSSVPVRIRSTHEDTQYLWGRSSVFVRRICATCEEDHQCLRGIPAAPMRTFSTCEEDHQYPWRKVGPFVIHGDLLRGTTGMPYGHWRSFSRVLMVLFTGTDDPFARVLQVCLTGIDDLFHGHWWSSCIGWKFILIQ